MSQVDEESYKALERERDALKRTVDALVEVAEARQAGEVPHGSFVLFDQNAALQSLVALRTEALEIAVHELGLTQAQLLNAQKLEAVGQLAAGVAHEINTPMQYIGDNVQFLQKGFGKLSGLLEVVVKAAETNEEMAAAVRKAKTQFLQERIPRSLEQTVEGVDAVSRIVAAMKAFSHPGSVEFEPTDLNSLLETTLTVSKNEWKYVAEVQREFASALPLVPAHGSELGQVFLNIIVNASHAIADAKPEGGGVIRIQTRQCEESGAVMVSIGDNGCGMPADVRKRAFDPFFTTKGVGKGTGQGLAIAHTIIRDHAGSIEIESAPGKGTSFEIMIPLVQAKAA
ncbi:MAG: sensor histidine kinase [Polyangiales bacterium]